MCSQLIVLKFLKVLDKLFSVMGYHILLRELNLAFMIFVGPWFKSVVLLLHLPSAVSLFAARMSILT